MADGAAAELAAGIPAGVATGPPAGVATGLPAGVATSAVAIATGPARPFSRGGRLARRPWFGQWADRTARLAQLLEAEHEQPWPAPGGWVERHATRLLADARRHPTATDALLVVVLAVVTTPWVVHHHASGGWSEFVLQALLLIPMVWRRRFPLGTFGFVATVALVQWSLDDRLVTDAALLLGLFTVAIRRGRRAGMAAAIALEIGAAMAVVRWTPAERWVEAFIFLSGMVAAALFLGINLRNRRAYLASLRDRAERLERERDQQARIATAAERTRIAREMHDIVAHSLSVMVTLADGATVKVAGDPHRAEAAMGQVSATGRQALGEMRRLLGVLRTDDGDSIRAPQPGVAQIDGLVEQVRATGVAAELTVSGSPVALTPGAEVAVYRIIQEALTNTLKHAVAPSRVRITLDYRPQVIEVQVTDDGGSSHANAGTDGPTGTGRGASMGGRVGGGAPTARSNGATPGPGHGLAGMRERAAVYGGTVAAGPQPQGGWRVKADLPVEAVAGPVTTPGSGLVAS